MRFETQFGQTPLDPDEAAGLIPRLSTQAELNFWEARNIQSGVAWLQKSKKAQRQLLRLDTMKEVHRRMFGDTWRWAGKFRVTQKSIGIEAYRIQSELMQLLTDASVWHTYRSYSPDEMLARLHHRLVWIHPFPNGNGRFARVVTDEWARHVEFELPTWGRHMDLPPAELRAKYIDALREADRHDFQPLIAFMSRSGIL